MLERTKGTVLLWADVPPEQRVGDGDPDALVAIVLALRERRMPADRERCQAASQGNTTAMGPVARRLVKLGRFFRCVQRTKRAVVGAETLTAGRFCPRHQAISALGAAAVKRSAGASAARQTAGTSKKATLGAIPPEKGYSGAQARDERTTPGRGAGR